MSKAKELKEVKLHIKVVINKEKTKVLFVEAGSDFTDVLLSFLLLPLATIVKVLKKHYGDGAPGIGSLTTLYDGAANLDSIHFEAEAQKQRLLSPIGYNNQCGELRLDLNHYQPTTLRCEKSYGGVFTRNAASFIISDDLTVVPNIAGSIMKTLSSLGIAVADIDGSETRDVAFGLNEVMALLKESLISQNPLTTLVLHKSQMNLKTEGHVSLHQIDQNVISTNSKKMNLNVTLQKSTNKLLFVQADYEFVNFLFGLLTISLGKVEWFLGSNAGLKNIDNLHGSLADDSNNKQLKNSHTKDLLIKSSSYICNGITSHFHDLNFSSSSRTFCHVKEESMYMVSDDLTVVPLGMTSCLSLLNGLKISLSDVEELELQVGLEEGLRIVKAALTSTTALTDGLIKPLFKKQAHQEMEENIGVKEISKKRPKLEC